MRTFGAVDEEVVGVVEFVFCPEQSVVGVQEGLVIEVDLMLLSGNLLVPQVYFLSVLLRELQVLSDIQLVPQEVLRYVQVVCPLPHQSGEVVLEELEGVFGVVVLLGEGAAVPGLAVELFAAVREGVLGLLEGVVVGLLVLVSTFDVLVGGDVFLELPCYFVATPLHEPRLPHPRLQLQHPPSRCTVELVAQLRDVPLRFARRGERAFDIVAADVVDLVGLGFVLLLVPADEYAGEDV